MLDLGHEVNIRERANKMLREAEQQRLVKIAQSSEESASKITFFSIVNRTLRKNTDRRQSGQTAPTFSSPLPDAG